MDFSTIKLFPDNLIKAIGNTLIHSLWQGLVLAAITGVIIVCTRKSSSARRYNLLMGALVLFTVAVVSTFMIEVYRPAAAPHNPVVYQITTVKMQQPAYAAPQMAQPGFTDKAIGAFNNNANTIVLIWFMIVCARCLQLATGLNGLYHLRRRMISSVDKTWENRVQQLAVKLGIRQIVSIAESGMAKVPMVIGHLKPLILIPIGLMTALSAEEIEAILVHELAHIRRRDYLINMLQSLMEIVFFFNPAVLWISALIKTERENCCDDIAVAQSSNKVNYIKALVSCQEYRMAAPAYAMAATGTKGHLVNRVKRILSNNNQSLNRLEKSMLAICLVAAGLFTAAFTNAAKIDKLVTTAKNAVIHHDLALAKNGSPDNALAEKKTSPEKDSTQSVTTVKTTTPTTTDTIKTPGLKIINPGDFGNGSCMVVSNDPYTSYISKDDGTFYQVNYLGKKMVSMQVDGKTIDDSQVAQYQPKIADILNRLKHVSVPGEPTAPAEPIAPKEKKELLKLDTATKRAAKLDKMQAKQGYLQAKANYAKDAAIADSVNKVYKKTGVSYRVTAMPAPPIPPATPAGYTADDAERRKQAIDDMLKEGIISTRDNLSFKLSTEEFIVNGKKQPEDVFLKYRARYVKMTGHNEWTWYYNYDTAAKKTTNSITDEPKN